MAINQNSATSKSASEANKLRLLLGVKCLPRWRFGLVFFAAVSLPVSTVSQKCATSKLALWRLREKGHEASGKLFIMGGLNLQAI
ncbi:MAG TPA: hypothetical protein PK992_02945, partial [Planctomycetaceae bacterium]|nr:hypothetical protein [Planctomycetaceae bacterium]